MEAAAMSTKVARQSPAAPSARYLELVRRFPLRRLRTAADADAATEILDQMFAARGADAGQEEYVEALALLLAAYEQEHGSVDTSDVPGHQVLEHLMEEHG